MYRLVLFLLIPLLSFAYVDTDMDGVEDKDDLCPNTLMTDLVDTTGCTIKSLVSPHHFSLQTGLMYANDDTYSATLSSLELGYNYKNLSLQLSTSYFDLQGDTLNETGLNDSYFNLYYQSYSSDKFSLTLGSGFVIPTYESVDNELDYTASLYGKYQLQDNWSLSLGLGYVFMNDTNTSNRFLYSLSSGYQWNERLYSSFGYSFSDNIYAQEEGFESLYFYNYYAINNNWFTSLSLTQGLNSVSLENSMGVKLGYYW